MQTFTPIQYLQIDIASNFGLDKEPWNDRLAWFAQHEADLEEIAQMADTNPSQLSKHPLMKQADSPALFFAGILAWGKAKRGEAISYPISLDATASGAQLLSVLIGCEQSARLCNVVDTGNREDLYTNVFSLMSQRLGTQDTITRAQAKTAVMTSLYGSTEQPKKAFGEGDRLACFYEVMETELPGIWALNQGLLELWNPLAYSHDWVLPDNFHVRVKVIGENKEIVEFQGGKHEIISKVNKPAPTSKSLGANTVHSIDGMVVREMSRRCSYDAQKLTELRELLCRPTTLRANLRSPNHELVTTLWQHYLDTGFLSARILELLDEDNMHIVDKAVIIEMVMTLPESPFPVLSVHDCFRVHPNNANDLRRQYNQILFELARSELMANLATQISGEQQAVAKYGDFSAKILQSNYALS